MFYTATSPLANPDDPVNPINSRSTIAEYSVPSLGSNVADGNSRRLLLSYDKPQFNHNGGNLAFGPDGLLYISTGDGGGSGDDDPGHTGGGEGNPKGGLGNSQDRTNFLGKILRIDVNGTANGQYTVPADNPFVGVGGGVKGGDLRLWFPQSVAGCIRRWTRRQRPLVRRRRGAEYRRGNRHRRERGELRLARQRRKVDVRRHSPHQSPRAADRPDCRVRPPGRQRGVAGIRHLDHRRRVLPRHAVAAPAGKYLFGDFSTAFNPPDGELLGMEETSPGVFSLSQLSVVGGNPIGRYINAFGRDENGEVYVATKLTQAASLIQRATVGRHLPHCGGAGTGRRARWPWRRRCFGSGELACGGLAVFHELWSLHPPRPGIVAAVCRRVA